MYGRMSGLRNKHWRRRQMRNRPKQMYFMWHMRSSLSGWCNRPRNVKQTHLANKKTAIAVFLFVFVCFDWGHFWDYQFFVIECQETIPRYTIEFL